MNQAEKLYFVTQVPLDLVERDRLHFDGTNRGNCLGPVALPPFSDKMVWKASTNLKREIIGKTGGKILVGGGLALSGVSSEEAKKLSEAPKFPNQEDPVFFHAPPICLGEELMHSYDLRAIFSLTVGQGDLALTCLRYRRPFFGLCLSSAHRDGLMARLEQLIWQAMQTTGDKLYEAGLVELIKACGPEDTQAEETCGKKRPRKPTPAEASDEQKEKPTKRQKSNKTELLAKIAALTGNKGATKDDDNNEDEDEDEEDSKSE